ncbi:MAG: glutamine--fructose-6-phosphate transaminase (isomerizing) [Simkaniaceae bacterium]
MCGIFGVALNNKKSSIKSCLEGLKKLEYRGYDSSGIAGIHKGELKAWKERGKISFLEQAIEKHPFELDVAIAHTRWATHGKPSQLNAHPQFDETHSLAIVHNGIIENHHLLREKLKKEGLTFRSDTDSEVIAQLISYNYKQDLLQALIQTLKELKGALAIAIVHRDYPNRIFAASRESPLAIGTNGFETYLASDPNAFVQNDLKIYFLHHDEIAVISNEEVKIFDANGRFLTKPIHSLNLEKTIISKKGFEHFMLKEIFDQPQSIQETMAGRFSEEFGMAVFEELTLLPKELQKIDHVTILACGSSYHASLIAASMLQSMARIQAHAEIASEFRYTNPIITENTLVIAISQSGETADTLAALREAKCKGAKTLGICNVSHSSLTREADSCLLLKAGPEISVCSTKAFTSQLALLSLFTLYMARLRNFGKGEGQFFLKELKRIPAYISQVLAEAKKIEEMAKKYAEYRDFFFIGRRYMATTSFESALKLKEISYLNATAYPAGEMKHGPIALLDERMPVIALCGNDQTYDKIMSNMMEVKARGAPLLAFAPIHETSIESITRDVIYLPRTCDELSPILYSVATQLFAYSIAREMNTEIDQPRNLAKSVTVE